MTFLVPTEGVASWRRLLSEPEKHWKTGRSAKLIANAWEEAAGFPPEVSSVLNRSGIDALQDLELLFGIPEHKVPLPGGRRASQTDIFVLASNAHGLVSIAVEGKVDEPFGPLVRDWLGGEPSPGKKQRLAFLCDILGIRSNGIGHLRYQLLHRTASAVIESRRFHAAHALMLVHSWAPELEGYDDYAAFVSVLGGVPQPDTITSTARPHLSLGWVRGDERWLVVD